MQVTSAYQAYYYIAYKYCHNSILADVTFFNCIQKLFAWRSMLAMFQCKYLYFFRIYNSVKKQYIYSSNSFYNLMCFVYL